MRKIICVLLLLGTLPRAHAEEVVFYRCTEPSGALTLQNMPCPKGHKQEKKVMQSVGTVPMGAAATTSASPQSTPPSTARPATIPPQQTPAPAAMPPPAVAAAPDPAPAVENRLPPPVLFQCITHDKDSYITESPEPPPRCVALRTVGLDGNPQTGAGEACEMMRDQCARVPDGALCDAWKKRMGETEVAWRFARAGNEQKNEEEFERTRKIYTESACGQ